VELNTSREATRWAAINIFTSPPRLHKKSRLKTDRQEGREEGREEGRKGGREGGMKEGRKEGRNLTKHFFLKLMKAFLNGFDVLVRICFVS
jgi:hypothetical protein